MKPSRTWSIVCTVFLVALIAGYGGQDARLAFAQDKVPSSPTEDTGKVPSKVPPAADEAPPPEGLPVPAEETPAPAEPTPLLPVDVPDQPELMDHIAVAQAELEAGFEPGEAGSFREILAQAPDANGAALFGQLFYARRHFARAAWFFAEAARANPNDASAFNNFGVMLDETYLNDPEARPSSWVRTALEAVRRADALRPNDPAIENNIGRGGYDLWRADADAADLEAAAAALAAAVTAEDDNVVFHTNEALVLDAAGDSAGAAAALDRAHALNAGHPSLAVAANNVSPATSDAYAGAARNYCSVDYHCGERCPPSIIGQINRVTCEMENSSAQMACGAGQPYARDYDCSEEIPEFGILIPGLNAGFTISSPWGSISAVVDGEGNVEWRVEGGPNLGAINPYIRFDGTYQPDGGWSLSDTRAGMKVNLFNTNETGQLLGEWGYQPVYIQTEGSTADESLEVSVGAYGNATIWH